MTREERIDLLNKLLEIEEKNDIGNLTRAERREFQQWVNKSLDQEPSLDKIRAEIEYTMKYQYAVGENQYAEGFEKSLEIIDKYKAESEADNGNDD